MPTLLRRQPVVVLAALLLPCVYVGEAKTAPIIPPNAKRDVYGDPLPENAIARIGTLRLRSSIETGHSTISPDGKLLIVTGYGGNPLQVWSTETGKLLRVIQTAEYQLEPRFPDDDRVQLANEGVKAIAFTPDSREIRVMTNRGTLRTCDVTTGKWSGILALGEGPKLKPGDSARPFARVSPDGTHFAYCSDVKPYCFEVFAIGKNKPILQLKDEMFGEAGGVPKFSADNKLVAVPLTGGTLKVWDTATGKVTATYSGPGLRLANAVFSPDGKSIAGVFVPKKDSLSFHDDWTLVVWDANTKKEKLRVPKWKGYVSQYTPDGSKLVCEALDDWNGEVLIAEASTGKVTMRLPCGWAYVHTVPMADDKRLVTIGSDQAITIWDTATGKPVHNFDGPHGKVNTLAFSPDGNTVLVGSNEHAAGLWDAQTGKRKHKLIAGGKGHVNTAVFTPNGEQVVVGYGFGMSSGGKKYPARLWNVADGKQVREYSALENGVYKLTLSPNGKQLLAKSPHGKGLAVWDFDTTKPGKEIAGAKDSSGDFLVYPNAEELIEVHKDRTKQRFVTTNLLSGKVIAEWQADNIRQMHAHSPDGRLVVVRESVSGQGDIIRIRKTADGKQVCELPVKSAQYGLCFDFSRENRTLVASNDNTVYLFDPTTGKQLREYRGHTGRITAIAFSPDGTRLATGSTDSTVLIWDSSIKP